MSVPDLELPPDPPSENLPVATPVAEVDVEPVAAGDFVVEIQQLREESTRWRGRFIAAGIAFVFLLLISVLQFIGTFITCHLLHVAQRDFERAQKETDQILKNLHDAQSTVERGTRALQDARQTIGKIDTFEIQLQRMQAQADRLDAEDADLERKQQALEAQRALHERLLRDLDAMLEQARRLIDEQRPRAEPLVDPNHKHAPACALTKPYGVRGGEMARLPPPLHLEEQEHEIAVRDAVPPVDPATVGPVTFARDVLPIFQGKCAACHMNSKKGGLSLKSSTDVLKGGDSGKVVLFGSLEKSLLWELVSTRQMPPEGTLRLTVGEIDIIRRWIERE
jgi:mono/diheme cytochrome c family protein